MSDEGSWRSRRGEFWLEDSSSGDLLFERTAFDDGPIGRSENDLTLSARIKDNGRVRFGIFGGQYLFEWLWTEGLDLGGAHPQHPSTNLATASMMCLKNCFSKDIQDGRIEMLYILVIRNLVMGFLLVRQLSKTISMRQTSYQVSEGFSHPGK
jgi:hypothetical protein